MGKFRTLLNIIRDSFHECIELFERRNCSSFTRGDVWRFRKSMMRWHNAMIEFKMFSIEDKEQFNKEYQEFDDYSPEELARYMTNYYRYLQSINNN